MISDMLRSLITKGSHPEIDAAQQALADAKAKRLALDENDPRRLADRDITQAEEMLAEVEHAQRQARYREIQGEAIALVSTYTEVAATFDARLAELSASLTEMSDLTQRIEEHRSQLWELSRTLQVSDIGVDFRPRDWFTQTTQALRRAWSQGQQT